MGNLLGTGFERQTPTVSKEELDEESVDFNSDSEIEDEDGPLRLESFEYYMYCSPSMLRTKYFESVSDK